MRVNTVNAAPAAEPEARESAMSVLLAGLMALVVAQQLFALPLSLAPGVSVENALLYVVAGVLAFKIAVQRNLRFDLRALHVCFAVLLIYAAVSIPAAALIADYWGYRPIAAVMQYKARLFDQFIFFAVFFYGLHSSSSAFTVLKALLLMTVLANLIALMDAWGVIDAAGLVERDDGRAQGVMGESNQSAAFIAAFLPGLAALAFMTKGAMRLVWLAGLVISATAMTISASRGGFLSIIVAVLWGLVYFRRQISTRAIITAAAVGAAILVVVMPIIASKYSWLLVTRIVEDSTSSNLAGVSSGRLDIWAGALSVMAQSPLSFFTGFGWGAYDAMPFRFATHNHYLSLWFDLGLPGLIYGTGVLVIAMGVAMRAATSTATIFRPVLIAFAIGTFAIAVAIFFVNLYTPWLWFWAYAGLVLRIAANSQHATQRAAAAELQATPVKARDPFGWLGSADQVASPRVPVGRTPSTQGRH